jgi:hypothetical protein
VNADDTLFQHTRESAQKFEYFLLGISLALLAYEGKTLSPQRLGLNAYTIEVTGLFLLVLSVIAGFKHIESMIAMSALNHDLLSAQTKRSRLAKGDFMYESFTGKQLTEDEREQASFQLRGVEDQLSKALDRTVSRSYRWNRVRMWLLIAALVVIILARVSLPYF